jgi:hypothetical protein
VTAAVLRHMVPHIGMRCNLLVFTQYNTTPYISVDGVKTLHVTEYLHGCSHSVVAAGYPGRGASNPVVHSGFGPILKSATVDRQFIGRYILEKQVI